MNDMNSADDTRPFVLDETEHFAAVFKPPRMHCAPLRPDERDTLLDWYAGVFPLVKNVSGRKAVEGGLLHRLDFETQGLVLFAKNEFALSSLLTQQDAGNFVKEYSAICRGTAAVASSFPPFTGSDTVIASFFRPYGPGRGQVRPVLHDSGRRKPAKDRGGLYRTEIVNSVVINELRAFTLRIKRGFRHQIRCHLAWMGCPVLNDPLYGEQPAGACLALRSTGLFFNDPENGRPLEYRIPPLAMTVNSL